MRRTSVSPSPDPGPIFLPYNVFANELACLGKKIGRQKNGIPEDRHQSSATLEWAELELDTDPEFRRTSVSPFLDPGPIFLPYNIFANELACLLSHSPCPCHIHTWRSSDRNCTASPM